MADGQEGEKLIAGILAALSEALRRCEGPTQQWTRRNLRRAMVLIGGLDEKTARAILDQEEIGSRTASPRHAILCPFLDTLPRSAVHDLARLDLNIQQRSRVSLAERSAETPELTREAA